jgi:hypothetical protein
VAMVAAKVAVATVAVMAVVARAVAKGVEETVEVMVAAVREAVKVAAARVAVKVVAAMVEVKVVVVTVAASVTSLRPFWSCTAEPIPQHGGATGQGHISLICARRALDLRAIGQRRDWTGS